MNEIVFFKKTNIPLDPRTKIFLTVTVSSILIGGTVGGVMNVIRPCLAAVPFILLLIAKKYKTATKFFSLYLVLFAVEIFVLPVLSGTFGFLLSAVVGIYSHMLPGFLMGYFLLVSTTVSEFVAAMERLHIPQKIVIPISVVFRFIPTVKEEYNSINDAMRMRGITSFRKPMQMLEYRVVPLIMSVVKIGEELSAAALTRGLGGKERRTNICKIGFGLTDVMMSCIAVVCWIAYFVA
jgi:energy-coupling factor transporter transmembrane protein EcfT